MASFRDRVKSDFLDLTFVAEEYEINFDKLSEGEEEDQYTGKFRVRSRSLPARRSQERTSLASHRASSTRASRLSQSSTRPWASRADPRPLRTGFLEGTAPHPLDKASP
ncbi:unnamed protein product [Effrenium voratum]|nr:unnamed protein product [Effrenium voratum]CAJ1444543.1 unnamed protein product [Effrenium voratum]